MALVNIELKTGIGKNGQPWFQARTIAQKYKGEPSFISELEYDYLSEILKPSSQDEDEE